jgi:predicted small lipoprotein YifL
MKKVVVWFFLVAVVCALTGCPTTGQSAKTAGDEVGNSAVDEATEATKDNVRKEVREGVNNAFKNIFD